MDEYYALTIAANGASTAAYYAVTPASNLRISEGGATIEPTSPSATMVNVYPQTLQIQSPAGKLKGGVTIVTGQSVIDCEVTVSPPVNTEVEVALYGAGGKRLGLHVVAPGESGGTFQFQVSTGDAIPRDDVGKILAQLLA